jgi:predicted ribosome quality control (RQC) complex YloA/Tae2 family protein
VDNFYLSALVQELRPEVEGRTVARVSLDGSALHIDLRLASGRQLLVSLDRTTPALYLSTEIASPSSKEQRGATFFSSLARKHLVGARLVKIWKEPLDRIVHIEFERLDAGDNRIRVLLRLFLTGRSANAYLADADGNIIGTLFEKSAADRLASSDSDAATIDP